MDSKHNAAIGIFLFFMNFFSCASPKLTAFDKSNDPISTYMRQMEWRDSVMKESINLLNEIRDTTQENKRRILEQFKHPKGSKK